jgi:hypothetical protein
VIVGASEPRTADFPIGDALLTLLIGSNPTQSDLCSAIRPKWNVADFTRFSDGEMVAVCTRKVSDG